MFIAKCPICDYNIKLEDEMDVLDLSICPICRFDFKSNKCSNPECRKPLHFSEKFCKYCGNESNFYLNCYDVRILFIDEE